MKVYLLGGPFHGEVLAVKNGTAIMREVVAKTATGIATFLCYYKSAGLMDSANRLVYAYDRDTAQFIDFVGAENITDRDKELLDEINQSFASRRLSIEQKIHLLYKEDRTLLQGILQHEVGSCKLRLRSSKGASRDQYVYITDEDAKMIRKHYDKQQAVKKE